jgi:hypothetical protein
MQYFAAHLSREQQTSDSLRASQYKPSRKRKREEDEDEDEDAEDPPISRTREHDTRGLPAYLHKQSYPSFDSLEAAQLRVAGLLPEDELDIPPGPFPHAPVTSSKDKFSYAALQDHLTAPKPPLVAANASSNPQTLHAKGQGPALRQTHFSGLITVMHRCLLQGDYQRAGRAWGMLLRTQVAGKPVDPRVQGRWGIGAELLLRRNAETVPHDDQDDQNSVPLERSIYTKEGFELAREYYERLIVQHPNRKQYPDAIDDRTFYPAMFSLWIYEVCEMSKRAREEVDDELQTNPNLSTTENARVFESEIHAEELRQAREIGDRLDQLTTSPPFDKHAELLQLRGMAGIWIGDLISQDEEGNETDQNNYGVHARLTTSVEKIQRYSESRMHLSRALEFLKRAQVHGKPLSGVIQSVNMKLANLAKRIAQLRE